MMKQHRRATAAAARWPTSTRCASRALFTDLVKEKPTPGGHNMIPGLFSWAHTIAMGKDVGATPNGRHAGAPISHGANPDPGFRKDGAPTALAVGRSPRCSPAAATPRPCRSSSTRRCRRSEGGVENVDQPDQHALRPGRHADQHEHPGQGQGAGGARGPAASTRTWSCA